MNLRTFIENPDTLKTFLVIVVALCVITSLKKLGRVMATVIIVVGILISLLVTHPEWAGNFWAKFDASNPWDERRPNKPDPSKLKPGGAPNKNAPKPAPPPGRK